VTLFTMMSIRFLKFDDVFNPIVAQDAIIHDVDSVNCPGFKEDYLLLHCLLRLWEPLAVVEVGTHLGRGTRVIRNAVGPNARVYSLDLPPEYGSLSAQYVSGLVGSQCEMPFTQLWGDSRTFDFSSLGPLDAFYIDGEHTYDHVHKESLSAIKTNASLIVYHDADQWEIFKGIVDAFYCQPTQDYQLHRVFDTRIMFALRRDAGWRF